MPTETRNFNLFVLLERSPSLPGIWVVHIPDLDTTVQGRSPSQALLTAIEAAQILILADLNVNLPPLRESNAERTEEHVRLGRVMTSAHFETVTLAELDARSEHFDQAAVQLPGWEAVRHVPDTAKLAFWPGETSHEARA